MHETKTKFNIDHVVKSTTSVRSWPDNLFISGGNPHLTSRFCEVVLGSTTISNMVSEPLHDSLGHLLSGFRYRATRHLCSCCRCAILSVRGCVKSPTSVRSWAILTLQTN